MKFSRFTLFTYLSLVLAFFAENTGLSFPWTTSVVLWAALLVKSWDVRKGAADREEFPFVAMPLVAAGATYASAIFAVGIFNDRFIESHVFGFGVLLFINCIPYALICAADIFLRD
ncbi:MAG TPA: hypothetical protein VK171_03700 [Fimbriimonas sp.]|nr:hypothetical protein [Fimbriimonas sp.]